MDGALPRTQSGSVLLEPSAWAANRRPTNDAECTDNLGIDPSAARPALARQRILDVQARCVSCSNLTQMDALSLRFGPGDDGLERGICFGCDAARHEEDVSRLPISLAAGVTESSGCLDLDPDNHVDSE